MTTSVWKGSVKWNLKAEKDFKNQRSNTSISRCMCVFLHEVSYQLVKLPKKNFSSFVPPAPPPPPVGNSLLIHEVSRLHTTTHHSRKDSSGRVISLIIDLYLTTHNTHARHLCPRGDSNPQSQQASGRRPMP
jgi:hypothetical protein